jgi:hypothetical protein
MFSGKARNLNFCTRREHLKDVSLGLALALLANITIGWQSLLGTNTVSFYKILKNAGEKSFTALASAAVVQLIEKSNRDFKSLRIQTKKL